MSARLSPPADGLLRRFSRQSGGNVAMMFGLTLLPMLGAIGLAVDFGSALTARNKAQVAADAAALQASGVARELMKVSDGSEAATSAALAEAKRRAESLFKAHAEQSGLENTSAKVSLTRTGQTVSTSVEYSIGTTAYMSRLFGQKAYTTNGKATSSSSLPTYSDVYLALDVSGSMGIAASQVEMEKLFYARGIRSDGKMQQIGCVFGCHVVEHGWTESYSSVAARNGVRMRIDVLRDAVKNMITTAQTDAEASLVYRLALSTLGGTPDASTWSLNQLAPLTNNFAQLQAAASTIDIMKPVSNGQRQVSYINEQLKAMLPSLPQSYDGTSQAKSKKYVFLITDGARDVPASFGSCVTPAKGSRCVNAIDPKYCKDMKDKGITVGVLYTTYVPVAKDPKVPAGPLEEWFKLEMVDTKVYPKIQPALQECASPGWFFEASDGDAIEVAMKAMFAQTSIAPSLTN